MESWLPNGYCTAVFAGHRKSSLYSSYRNIRTEQFPSEVAHALTMTSFVSAEVRCVEVAPAMGCSFQLGVIYNLALRLSHQDNRVATSFSGHRSLPCSVSSVG